MIRRPPRSTQGVSSAASDVYKRQVSTQSTWGCEYFRLSGISSLAMFAIRRFNTHNVIELKSEIKPLSEIFCHPEIEISVINSPNDIVISGNLNIITSILHSIKKSHHIVSRSLEVAGGFHTSKLKVYASDFAKFTENLLQNHNSKSIPVSYTHLRAHETSLHLVCRLLLEKKKKKRIQIPSRSSSQSTTMRIN
eukprot:TRINITY_DN26762_c0_g1_i1.p1 TRINITY_DN26762_c0_g1~~TRINITY_DN26762_c0_g1_i1.p1  ORF type:complete len:194 (+),score=34.73 TRINITY_DN26762_c0_g1_i1:121-702(+)